MTAAGLTTLVLVVWIAIDALPSAEKGQNVVALATSAFGVIGAVVGAYFGIRSSSSAADHLGGGDTSGERRV